MAKIPQVEARRLKKRVAELESILSLQRERYASQWPGGCHITTMTIKSEEFHIVNTARKLGHAAVLVPSEYPMVHVYGCPLPK